MAIAAGWGHSLALAANGTVISWGDNSFGQCNVPDSATNVIAIGAGYAHSLAVRYDGSVVAWGSGFLGSTNLPYGMNDVVRVAVGENHSLALIAQNGTTFSLQRKEIVAKTGGPVVLVCGAQNSGSFTYQWFHDGIAVAGATNRVLLLSSAAPFDAGDYTLVATGAAGPSVSPPVHLTVQPTLADFSAAGAWGDNYLAQCYTPRYLDNPCAIAAGAFHNLALQADGTVVAWGNNRDGQTNVPPEVTNVIAIAAGGCHSLAVRDDGTAVGWGGNWDGQSGSSGKFPSGMRIV